MKTSIKNHGFILIMTMIFMAVFTLMTVTLMQRMMYSAQVVHASGAQYHAFSALESAADFLLNNQQHEQSCYVPSDTVYHVNADWLKNNGCKKKLFDDNFYYIYASIGLFPCLQLDSVSKPVGTQHEWLLMTSQQAHHRVLWIRIARVLDKSACPKYDMIRKIKERVSWNLQIDEG